MITEQEFTTIYNSYASKVHRLCLGYASGNNELANEWLQETFVKVWKHRNSFKGKSSIDTWIYRIAVNVCLGDLRKSRKSITINEEVLSNSIIDDNNDNDEKNIKKMYHCIEKLNEQNRALILLELENIQKNLINKDRKLQAQGGLTTMLGE